MPKCLQFVSYKIESLPHFPEKRGRCCFANLCLALRDPLDCSRHGCTESHLRSTNILLLYHENLDGLFFVGFLLPNSRTGFWLPEPVSLAGERLTGMKLIGKKKKITEFPLKVWLVMGALICWPCLFNFGENQTPTFPNQVPQENGYGNDCKIYLWGSPALSYSCALETCINSVISKKSRHLDTGSRRPY